MEQFDVVVVGAGAAGMMCAIEASKRGRSVLIIDHAEAPGEKIRISGGGRCNFTNLGGQREAFLSQNPRFCLSALGRYTPADFLALMAKHKVTWCERDHGQLFCEGSARQVVTLLLEEMDQHGVILRLGEAITRLEKTASGFEIAASSFQTGCSALVIATGGKSIPKMGASGFGYEIAAQFGLKVVETRPGLAPLTLDERQLKDHADLAGVGLNARVRCGKRTFEEGMLFTHRGLSGPAILQISSYWLPGQELEVDLAPGVDLLQKLRLARRENGRQAVQTVLARDLPRRLAQRWAEAQNASAALAETSEETLRLTAQSVNRWRVKPMGSEGYRTAEVTLGGVATDALDQRTFEVKSVAGLYFIGEVVDVTGWLGGYNFQWAWASGWCAGQAV